MKTKPRFDNAVTKLYNAFHEGTLNAFDCKECAVGNIVGSAFYGGYSSFGTVRDVVVVGGNKSGYSPTELYYVEKKFMEAHLGGNTEMSKIEKQFKGLCAVVEYLCELDNIPNVMDYTRLFETENEKPKYQLS